MSRLFVALCVSALIACGSSSKYDQQQTQVAITPKGSIVGRVTEYASNAPLEGVKVTALLSGGAITATTSADGLYEIKDVVVSSSVSMLFEKDGYLRSITSGAVPGAVGNSPLTQGIGTRDVRMAKGDGTIKGLLRLPNNTPAVGATIYVDQRNSGFDAVVTTTTDMAGAFTLTGLATAPSGINHQVYAQWFDENADGLSDYNPTSTSVTLYSGGTAARVFLNYSSLGQRILATNLYAGTIAAADDIKLTFAVPARESGYTGSVTNQFQLFDNTRGTTIAVDATWASTTEVTLKTGGLREGDQYSLSVSLQTSTSGNFNQSLSFQVRASTVTGPATPVANVTVLNNGSGDRTKFDYSSNSFTVSFDVQPGIQTYWVYAKGSVSDTAFNLVSQTTFSNGGGRAIVNGVYVPFNNGYPLSQGNKVTFVVVPVDVYGNAGATSAATGATISDNVAPAPQSNSLYAVTDIDAINDTAAATQIQLGLSYSEPMDPASPPKLTSTAAATIDQSFAWNSGNTSGVLTLTVPAKTDLSGSFVIRGGKDTSGNAVSGAEFTGVLGGRKELLLNGGFEDATGACSLTGWTPAQTGNMTAATSQTGAGIPNVGRCAALIGAPIGGPAQTGTAKLTQDVALPSLTNLPYRFELTGSTRAQYFLPSGAPTAVTQICKLTDTADASLATLRSYSGSSNSSYFNDVTAVSSALANTTVRVNCSIDNSAATASPANLALYVDNLSLSLVKDTTLNK